MKKSLPPIPIPNMLKTEVAREHYRMQMEEFRDKNKHPLPQDLERARITAYRDALEIQNNPYSVNSDNLLEE